MEIEVDHSEETRAIYHAQHQRIVADDRAMTRFIGMFSHEYFGLPHGWFEGKRVLDAGCGDTAKLLISLHKMGGRDLHGFDLGEDFIPIAKASSEARGAPGIEFRAGNLLAPPYEPESFDFVACHGVMVHLNTLDEVRTAFAELAKLVKPGGYLYTVYGSVGGLLEDAIFPAVRAYYRENPAFKAFIDNLKPGDLHRFIDLSRQGIIEHEGVDPAFMKLLPDLLDEDLCVFFQNVIQCPVRLKIDEAMIREMHADACLENPQRLKRYVERKNIRRYLAPLHYNHEAASLLYGSGYLEFLTRKPS